MVESVRVSNMKQYLLFAVVFVAILVLSRGHPLEDQQVTLEDAEVQPGIDDGTGVRAARHFGGGFGGFGGRGGGGFCCGGGGGFRRGGFGGGGYPGGGYGGYPGGGYGGGGGGSASASASASASSSWGR
ncbi:glycine-rich RNA-binding protein 2 [Drosophila elegans]|uniref:glycine-rich RNA-binding protein 2 n=1 Tax=Drosophila elegans TaxID=30023 RepID=UPI0007E67E5D|nr:glycine-rich RNA-binding protein 2 [Drosophila elegans]